MQLIIIIFAVFFTATFPSPVVRRAAIENEGLRARQEEDPTMAEDPAMEDPREVLCVTCSCAVPGTLNCADRDLTPVKKFFSRIQAMDFRVISFRGSVGFDLSWFACKRLGSKIQYLDLGRTSFSCSAIRTFFRFCRTKVSVTE